MRPILKCAASVLFVFAMALITVFSGRNVNADGDASAKKGASADKADYILTDAKIYTADSSRSMAEALAVRDGKIIFVGTSAEAAKLAGKKTVIEKAGGKLVLPGLI